MEKVKKEKSNILYISSFGNLKGGGQRSLLLLLKNLDKSRFVPFVIVPVPGSLEQELSKLGIESICFSFPRIRSTNVFAVLAALLRLKAIVKDNDIDIIHTDSTRETFYAGIVKLCLKVAVVIHLRVSDKVRWIDRIICKLATRMIAVSKALTSRFDGMDVKNKIDIIYNAVDIDEYKPQPKAKGAVTTLIIGYFGRIVRRKSIEVLIRAVKNLKADVSLLIMGSGDEQYIADLKLLAKEDARIEFRTYKQDVRDEINSVDVVVLPSVEGEGLSRIIIEAMALAKIAVVSDKLENLEALGDDLKEFAFKSGDENDLMRILEKIQNDSTLKETVGNLSRKRAETFFDAKKNTRLIEDVYDSILGKN